MKNHTRHRRKPVALVAAMVAVLAVAGLTGCGSDGRTKTPGSSGQSLAITVKGDAVTPTNKRIEVKLDQPLTITVRSDRSGELHVHSSPEQHIEFEAGTTTHKITLKVPGVVELEEHKSDTLVAQLEVR